MANHANGEATGSSVGDYDLRRRHVPAAGENGSAHPPSHEIDDKKSAKVRIDQLK